MKQTLFAILTLTLLLTSCEKNPTADSSSIVFGKFYGFCAGEECVELFKITKDGTTVYEDTKDGYPNGGELYEGVYSTEITDKPNISSEIFDAIPNELLETASGIIGQPDAYDQGGYYIEYKDKDQHLHWSIDQARTATDASLHDFLDLVDAKVQELK